jgi:hypothetical protein
MKNYLDTGDCVLKHVKSSLVYSCSNAHAQHHHVLLVQSFWVRWHGNSLLVGTGKHHIAISTICCITPPPHK